jgi:hypothetical protein
MDVYLNVLIEPDSARRGEASGRCHLDQYAAKEWSVNRTLLLAASRESLVTGRERHAHTRCGSCSESTGADSAALLRGVTAQHRE